MALLLLVGSSLLVAAQASVDREIRYGSQKKAEIFLHSVAGAFDADILDFAVGETSAWSKLAVSVYVNGGADIRGTSLKINTASGEWTEREVDTTMAVSGYTASELRKYIAPIDAVYGYDGEEISPEIKEVLELVRVQFVLDVKFATQYPDGVFSTDASYAFEGEFEGVDGEEDEHHMTSGRWTRKY